MDSCNIVEFPVAKLWNSHLQLSPLLSCNKYTVFFMDKFPKADLTIELLKCDGRSFITKPTRIATYFNQEFDCIEDSPHLRKMLGLMD
jgi:hypothetical protein